MNDRTVSIRRSAHRLRLATLFLILLYELGVAFGAWLLVAGREPDFPLVRVHAGALAPWPAALTLLALGLLVGLALLRLARLLSRVEAGAEFGIARDLRGFALFLFLAVLANLLLPPLLTLLLEPGRPIHLDFGSNEALMLLITGLLFFVARLLDAAQRLADDHSQIV